MGWADVGVCCPVTRLCVVELFGVSFRRCAIFDSDAIVAATPKLFPDNARSVEPRVDVPTCVLCEHMARCSLYFVIAH